MKKKKKAFKLRTKPEKPQRKTDIREEFSLDEGDSLAAVIDWAKTYDVHFDNVRIEMEYGYYDDSDHLIFKLMRPEPDEAFAIRMAHYERQLELYIVWEAENKEAMATELEERAKKAEKKKEKEAKKEEQQLAKLEKDVARLRKKLNKK